MDSLHKSHEVKSDDVRNELNPAEKKTGMIRHILIFAAIAIVMLFSISIIYTNAEIDKRIDNAEHESQLLEEKRNTLIERMRAIELENNMMLLAIEEQKKIDAAGSSVEGADYDVKALEQLLEEQANLEKQIAEIKTSTATSASKQTFSAAKPKTTTTISTASSSQSTQTAPAAANTVTPAATPPPAPTPPPVVTPPPAPAPLPTTAAS